MNKVIYHYDHKDFFYFGPEVISESQSIPHAATDIAPLTCPQS